MLQRRMTRLFITHFPYLDAIHRSCRIVEPTPDQNISTAAVSSDGVIFINPDFAATLTDEQLAGLLLHEAQHLVLMNRIART